MIIDTKTTDSVTEVTKSYLKNTFVNKKEMLDAATTIVVLNISHEYVLFKRTLLANGYDLDEICYIKIFQVVTEVMLLHHNPLIDDTNDIQPDELMDILMEITLTELNQECMYEYLNDMHVTTCELVTSIFNFYTINYIHEYLRSEGDVSIYVPIRWSYGLRIIAVELCGYGDA